MVDLFHIGFFFNKEDILLRLILNSCPMNSQISILSIQVVSMPVIFAGAMKHLEQEQV